MEDIRKKLFGFKLGYLGLCEEICKTGKFQLKMMFVFVGIKIMSDFGWNICWQLCCYEENKIGKYYLFHNRKKIIRR